MYAIASKPLSHPITSQTSAESPESPIQTTRVKQLESPPIIPTKVSPKLEVKSSSSPTRRSPTMMTSNEGGNSNIPHLAQPPYGLSHQFGTYAVKLLHPSMKVYKTYFAVNTL